MTSAAVAEESGLMAVTDRAIESRKAHKIVGEVIAHYQMLSERERGSDFYWVECYGDGGFESGHPVEVLIEGGDTWASCTCDWFLKYRKPTTVCKHILAVVLMARKRG